MSHIAGSRDEVPPAIDSRRLAWAAVAVASLAAVLLAAAACRPRCEVAYAVAPIDSPLADATGTVVTLSELRAATGQAGIEISRDPRSEGGFLLAYRGNNLQLATGVRDSASRVAKHLAGTPISDETLAERRYALRQQLADLTFAVEPSPTTERTSSRLQAQVAAIEHEQRLRMSDGPSRVLPPRVRRVAYVDRGHAITRWATPLVLFAFATAGALQLRRHRAIRPEAHVITVANAAPAMPARTGRPRRRLAA